MITTFGSDQELTNSAELVRGSIEVDKKLDGEMDLLAAQPAPAVLDGPRQGVDRGGGDVRGRPGTGGRGFDPERGLGVDVRVGRERHLAEVEVALRGFPGGREDDDDRADRGQPTRRAVEFF